MSNLEEKTQNERVTVNMRMTRNLGDFNSLSIDLGLSRDLRSGESVSQAYASIRAGLEKELDKAFEDALGE